MRRKKKLIPVCKIGHFEVKHERDTLALLEDGFWWIGLCRDDLTSQQFAIDQAKGKILIGGLGLGWVVEQMAEKKDVTGIIVVEIAQEVIDLVWKYLDTKNKAQIICDDIFQYLKNTSNRFDFIYLDVHRDISEEQYRNVVIPLRKLAEKLIPSPRNVCIWEEKKMRKLYYDATIYT